jgi:hypothetical protein
MDMLILNGGDEHMYLQPMEQEHAKWSSMQPTQWGWQEPSSRVLLLISSCSSSLPVAYHRGGSERRSDSDSGS